MNRDSFVMLAEQIMVKTKKINYQNPVFHFKFFFKIQLLQNDCTNRLKMINDNNYNDNTNKNNVLVDKIIVDNHNRTKF